jgi:hypothetical protein
VLRVPVGGDAVVQPTFSTVARASPHASGVAWPALVSRIEFQPRDLTHERLGNEALGLRSRARLTILKADHETSFFP